MALLRFVPCQVDSYLGVVEYLLVSTKIDDADTSISEEFAAGKGGRLGLIQDRLEV
jgi:predicted AAA+ superfamily ATPase